MFKKDWFFFYSILKKYYTQLRDEGYISDEDLNDCVSFMYECSLSEMQDECLKLGVLEIPYVGN